ncbi:hypothetical protein [Clostridium sardiniense]|uniref:hypothetical protein n=1 Tax=Clostridium sardiniense TaxID=29369 RepID=UPI0019579506|nr:hypothetical protein [Clostridium sardiniense]MBM7836248.1 hypothetical protein [Clostridium sardiniense]
MINKSINKKSKQYSFDSFYKKVLNNEVIDSERRNKNIREKQILFSELTERQMNILSLNEIRLSTQIILFLTIKNLYLNLYHI